MKKLTTAEFINKCNKIHNMVYDYSKVYYENSTAKVCIICKSHGEFFQSGNSHIQGHGCKQCAIENNRKAQKLSSDEFIQRGLSKHGKKYDYSLVNYINIKTKVKIKCIKHGNIMQTPEYHLQGVGCPKCGNAQGGDSNKLNNNIFIKRAIEIHNNKYDYSGVQYINSAKKVNIICKKHGTFSQTPNNHSQGQGCPKCGRTKTAAKLSLTTKQFIKRANKLYNGKYRYTKVKYLNHMSKVIITCPEHGDFKQRPNDHLNGYKCMICANADKSLNMTHTTEQFINSAIKIHGNEYDYSSVVYIKSKSKIKIICKHHGEFLQTPRNHLSKNGCPKCSHKVSFKETAWLDSLNIPNDIGHRQVSLLINCKKIHVDGFDQQTNTVYEYHGDFWHGNPKIYNPEDINPVNKKTYGELYKRTMLREHLIISEGYKLITHWESDE